ncbi:MAG: hypothetical protein N2Z62_10920 [Rhodobacteraceae bacterium]|nr:hypothetical protein [Paracoccaceae bacterium]
MVRLAAVLLVALGSPVAADSSAAGPLRLDLNRLDPQEGSCRLTFVVENRLAALDSLVLETVLFDRAGRVAALTLFDFGELPEARRRVRQFDVAGQVCDDIAQVLVNGVAACTGDSLAPAACAAALSVTGSVEGVEVSQ